MIFVQSVSVSVCVCVCVCVCVQAVQRTSYLVRVGSACHHCDVSDWGPAVITQAEAPQLFYKYTLSAWRTAPHPPLCSDEGMFHITPPSSLQ